MDETMEIIMDGKFSVWDYAVFVAMLAISAGIGIYYAYIDRANSSTNEFLMGNRSLSVLPVSVSVLASFMSAITLLGLPAEIYQFGTMYGMISIAFILTIPATAHLFLPVFYELQLTSAYEYLEKRFNRTIRTMGSIIFTIHMLMYMPLVLYAPSLALAQVTGLNVIISVLSLGIVCTFYTSIGGIKAVVVTDFFQTILMFASIFIIVFKGAFDQGGLDVVWEKNLRGERIEFFRLDLDPTVRHTVWGLSIGAFFTWMGNYAVSQAMVQRYLTIPTLRGAKTCIWLNLPQLVILIAICSFSGMVVYGRYFNCDPILVQKVQSPDQLFPLFVMDTLSSIPGLPGLFVAGVFSGALSTVSSGVNSLAAVTLTDFIKPYVKKELSEQWATRITKIIALSYGLLSIALVAVAAQLGDILQAGLAIHGMIGGPMLGVFTIGMFFPWANSLGAGIGLVSGFVVAFWIGIGTFIHKIPQLKAPVSVEGCLDLYRNVTGLLEAPLYKFEGPPDDIFYGYKLSYVWYSTIGFVTVVVVSIVVSLISGRQKPENVNAKLITPIVRKLFVLLKIKLGTNYEAIKIKMIEINEDFIDVPGSKQNIGYSGSEPEMHELSRIKNQMIDGRMTTKL